MGWGRNVTAKTSSGSSWNEVLESGSDPLDLPKDLAMIDIERSLPKLSILPAGGTS